MRVWHRTVTRGCLASFLHYVTVDSYHSGCLEYWPWRIRTQDCDTWIPVSCTMWLLTAIIQVAWNTGLEGYGHRTVTREYQFPALCDCWQLSFRLPGILALKDMDTGLWHMNTSFLHYVTVDSYHTGCMEYWPWRIWTQDCDTWIPVSCTMWLLTAIIQVAWNTGLEGYGHRTVTHEYQFPALCDCWQLSFRLPGILAMRDMTQDCDTWIPVSCTVTVDSCRSGCLEYWPWGIWHRIVTHEYQFPALWLLTAVVSGCLEYWPWGILHRTVTCECLVSFLHYVTGCLEYYPDCLWLCNNFQELHAPPPLLHPPPPHPNQQMQHYHSDC